MGQGAKYNRQYSREGEEIYSTIEKINRAYRQKEKQTEENSSSLMD